jgi:hypothetical protein
MIGTTPAILKVCYVSTLPVTALLRRSSKLFVVRAKAESQEIALESVALPTGFARDAPGSA